MHWTTILVAASVVACSSAAKCYGRCRQDRVFRLKSADCYNQNFERVPQCLPSDTEVVDLTYNRIRMIRKEDLRRYTSLKVLYLNENSIFRIHDDAFEGQDELIALDLSVNALPKVPSAILHLPSLKRLYLSQNQNMNVVGSFEESKPITSPLVYLDIGFNELRELPDLGVMPFLVGYNVSGNDVEGLTSRHFAGLCHLQTLVKENFTATFEDPCECFRLEEWLVRRKVNFTSFDCQGVKEDCYLDVPEEDLVIYNNCAALYEEVLKQSRMTKILISVSVIVVVILVAILYVIYRRRRRIRKERKKMQRPPEAKLLI